jgi:hypothetical protein
MVSVRDCYDGGGIVTAGSGHGAFCDGGVHTGKPVELTLHEPNGPTVPIGELQAAIQREVAALGLEKKPFGR